MTCPGDEAKSPTCLPARARSRALKARAPQTKQNWKRESAHLEAPSSPSFSRGSNPDDTSAAEADGRRTASEREIATPSANGKASAARSESCGPKSVEALKQVMKTAARIALLSACSLDAEGVPVATTRGSF